MVLIVDDDSISDVMKNNLELLTCLFCLSIATVGMRRYVSSVVLALCKGWEGATFPTNTLFLLLGTAKPHPIDFIGNKSSGGLGAAGSQETLFPPAPRRPGTLWVSPRSRRGQEM